MAFALDCTPNCKTILAVYRTSLWQGCFDFFPFSCYTKIYVAAIEELPEKYGVIGFDCAGNPIEVVYTPIDDNAIYVFHAMRARKSFIKMMGL